MNQVPVRHGNSAIHRRVLADAINALMPVVQSGTLTLSSTTTAITDERMGDDKTVVIIPTNAAMGAEAWALTTKSNGSFVLTHASSGTSRTFDYIILG